MAQLPILVAAAAAEGDFERVEAWLAGGTASHPRSVSDVDDDGWTLLAAERMIQQYPEPRIGQQ